MPAPAFNEKPMITYILYVFSTLIMICLLTPALAASLLPSSSPSPHKPPTGSGPIHVLSQITNSGTDGFRPLPEKGLAIPDIPTQRADGSFPPRKDSWRQIIQQWTEGDPARGLHLPLRDWPYDWMKGKNISRPSTSSAL